MDLSPIAGSGLGVFSIGGALGEGGDGGKADSAFAGFSSFGFVGVVFGGLIGLGGLGAFLSVVARRRTSTFSPSLSW